MFMKKNARSGIEKSRWTLVYIYISPVQWQLCSEATEAGHLRHRPDGTHLQEARHVVQSGSGAATVLRRREEPRSSEDQADVQQGQLRLSSRGGGHGVGVRKWLKRGGKGKVWHFGKCIYLLSCSELGDLYHWCLFVQYEARASILLN